MLDNLKFLFKSKIKLVDIPKDRNSGFVWSSHSRKNINKLPDEIKDLLFTALRVSAADFGVSDIGHCSFDLQQHPWPIEDKSDFCENNRQIISALREASIQHQVDIRWGNNSKTLADSKKQKVYFPRFNWENLQ